MGRFWASRTLRAKRNTLGGSSFSKPPRCRPYRGAVEAVKALVAYLFGLLDGRVQRVQVITLGGHLEDVLRLGLPLDSLAERARLVERRSLIVADGRAL